MTHPVIAPPGGWEPIWTRAFEIARALNAEQWLLVGGLMVQAHAYRCGVPLPRSTRDVDMVVEIAPSNTVATVVADLGRLGYTPSPSIDRSAPFHRMARRGPTGTEEVVDVMAPDSGRTPRHGGRDVLRVPASRSALRRSQVLYFAGQAERVAIRVPDLVAALALKGAAYRADSRDRERHLQDGLTLLACVDDSQMLNDTSRSMRKNLNVLIEALSKRSDPWIDVAPLVANRASALLSEHRPGWRHV